MLKILTTTLKRGINVYEGVSPSLLATMSLAVDIKGTNQTELINSLAKANLIETKEDVPAWLAVDRRYFTKSANPYLNKPCPISNGESMTDIFTHAIVVNNVSQALRDKVRVLDIGTGHGYLSFLIAKILEGRRIRSYEIRGIDINEQAIEQCKNIQNTYFGHSSGKVSFHCGDLKEYLEKQATSFDVIIGGYYLEPTLSEKLVSRMTEQGVGVWSSRSESGQALFKIQPKKEKVYLMETLFSMPVVRTKVEHYFITEKDKNIEQFPQSEQKDKKQHTNQEKMAIRKQMEEKLRGQLKLLLQKHRKSCGKVLSLNQMRQNPEIKQKLDSLQKLSKTKIKLPSK